MDNTGSQDMIRFKNFFSSIPWQKLVPDFAHTVVMAGYSSGTTTVTTGRASDGSFVVSYHAKFIEQHHSGYDKIGRPVRWNAHWYDPT